MQLTQKRLKRVNIFSTDTAEGGYVGKKQVPRPLGFVYAEVLPEKEQLCDERNGRKTKTGATLILRRGAGVSCGDLAGVYGDDPDSRVLEVRRCPSHITVRTQRI